MSKLNNKGKIKKIISQTLIHLFVIAVLAIIIFPLIWMIPAAWKNGLEIKNIPPKWFPNSPTWQNFEKVFKVTRDYNFGKSLLMTGIVAILATIGSLFINTLAAYAFARIDFPFKKLLWVLYLFPMFVPGITILLTSLRVVDILHMKNTLLVLFVPSLASAYQAFFFRQFFLGIPSGYEEAAEIDGCSKLSIYFRIFLPMSVTPLIIQGVGIFLGHWNSFLWPALTVDNDYQQVMQVIRWLFEHNSNDYGVVIAASLISMLPPLIIFAIAQKQIVQGAVLSGIK